MKPYAESCDQNREPILTIIKHEFAASREVLEIGSGTGQHAIYFAQQLPHLIWHTSDCLEYHDGIRLWLDEVSLPNTQGPYALDVNQDNWPLNSVDAVFSANTCHIMDWPSVINMFKGIGRILEKNGIVCLYGPFNYNGEYTTDSNRRFDVWLKQRDPHSGVRDFADLDRLARDNQLAFRRDHAMPANNRILVWQKI